MTNLNSIFFLNAIYFILAAFLAFYIPGNLILKKLKLTSFQEAILSVLVGVNFWAWQGFIFGYLQQRWLSYIYLLVTSSFWTYYLIKKVTKQERAISKKTKKQITSINAL